MSRQSLAPRALATIKDRPSSRWGRGDEIGRTARRVRVTSTVHTLVGRWFSREVGHYYRTDCGLELYATDGAMLTTRYSTCVECDQQRALAGECR